MIPFAFLCYFQILDQFVNVIEAYQNGPVGALCYEYRLTRMLKAGAVAPTVKGEGGLYVQFLITLSPTHRGRVIRYPRGS
jgi:hypothetical protein